MTESLIHFAQVVWAIRWYLLVLGVGVAWFLRHDVVQRRSVARRQARAAHRQAVAERSHLRVL